MRGVLSLDCHVTSLLAMTKGKLMNRGKFIVLYGANNLGKSTQARMLVDSLKAKGINAAYIKYPIYDLAPTGPKIYDILHGKLPLPKEENLQKLFVQNRKDFEPELEKILESGTWVVAEDYTGTGIAWGMVRGLKVMDMEKLNEGLLKEDLGILIDGKRFVHSVEKGHINEEQDEIWEKAREKHLELGEKYGWKKVNANQDKEKIAEEIWKNIENKLLP